MKKIIALSTMLVCLCMFSLGCPKEGGKPAPPPTTPEQTATDGADAAPADNTDATPAAETPAE